MDETAPLVPDVNHFIVAASHIGPLMEITTLGDREPRLLPPTRVTLDLQSVGEFDMETLSDLIGRRVVLLVVT